MLDMEIIIGSLHIEFNEASSDPLMNGKRLLKEIRLPQSQLI